MKNIPRHNKFLLCFRPVVDMDHLILESRPAVSGRDSDHKASVPEIVKPPSRTFSQVIKAVLFEAMLAKRVRDRKSLTQDAFQSSKKSFSTQTHKSLASRDHYNQLIKAKSYPVLSSQSSDGSSSSSSSKSSSPTCSTSEPKTHQERKAVSTKPSKIDEEENMGGPGKGSAMIIWLLIVILSVICIWSRLNAILCTTICLYCLPRQSTGRRRPENEAKSLRPVGEYTKMKKRKIIIEGLIERNRHKESALNT